MSMTVRDILLDADAFRRAYPNWPHPEPRSEEKSMSAITWKPRDPGHGTVGHDGRVGNLTLFTIGWAGGKQPYVLHTYLAGYTSQRWRKATEEEARGVAERVLAKWLADLGAVLVSCPEKPED